MTMRKLVLLVCLGLIPLAALAQEEPRTYIIKKGDTLWGISERFITDPYYWPSMWAHNPRITNPHFIYPGQQLKIYDGRIEIVPGPAPAPPVTEAAAPVEEPQVIREAITIKTPAAIEGFIGSDEFADNGVLVDTVDNRIMMGAGDKVFVEMRDLAGTRPGDRFSVYQLGKEVLHPVTGEKMGYKVIDSGSLTIDQVHAEVATATITTSSREIQRGARIRPWQPPVQEVALKKARQTLTGYLVAGGSDKIALGQYDVIYVDLGAQDGLETGNLLYISRPRQASEHALREDIQLPDVLLGSAVVLETQVGTASALVLKSVAPMYRGDQVTTVVE